MQPVRRVIFLILAHLVLAGPAIGYDILLVQSSRNTDYDRAASSLRSACGTSSRTIVLPDYVEVDISRVVREERPRLVVALGDQAWAAVKKIRQAPLLALMTLGVTDAENRSIGATGVSLFAAPKSYLPVFQGMKAGRVGVIFNPSKTGWYVRQLTEVAHHAGITIVSREVSDPREVVAKLSELAGKVDALWLVPDITAVSRNTLSAYFEFSLRYRVPVVSFTATHLPLGAAAAVEIDRGALGRQAGEMAEKMLEGITDLPVAPPRTLSIRVNGTVVKNLGLPHSLLE